MVVEDFVIQIFDAPRSLPVSRVTEIPATALLVAGIVNPYGPTLTAVVALGEPATGATLPVARVVLNPFSQEAQTVGELEMRSGRRAWQALRPLFLLEFGSCPSLLLPSTAMAREDSEALHAEFLRGFGGARDLLRRVKKYYANPWERVSQEMRDLTASRGNDQQAPPLSERESGELASLLLADEHIGPELQAFCAAWRGSIKNAPHPGSSRSAMRSRAVLCRIRSPNGDVPAAGAPAADAVVPAVLEATLEDTGKERERCGSMKRILNLRVTTHASSDQRARPEPVPVSIGLV